MQLITLIKAIQQNPANYPHGGTLGTLWSFLQGFQFAHPQDDPDLLQGFNQWVQSHYDLKVNHSAYRLILLQSHHETEAAVVFFRLWNQFIEELKSQSDETNSLEKPPMNRSSLIDHIKQRPGMYVGSTSFHDFLAFVDGYCLGIKDDPHFDRFARWISHYFLPGLKQPWFKILECFTGNKMDLLSEFFTLWDDFKRIDAMIERHRQNPKDQQCLFEAVEACCESNRFEGIALISHLLEHFDLDSNHRETWLTRQRNLSETWSTHA